MAAVYGFERQSPAMFEDTVGEDDVAEASTAFRAELDTSGTVSVVGGLRFVELPAAVQYASFVESADVAVADGNVLRIFETSQRIGGFQNDGVIPRGVDRALADAYVAAAVNVESVTVGIYFQVKQGKVLYTSGKQGEVSAMEHGEVFQRDVPAILETDRFVAYTRQAAFFASQSFAVDQSRTADGDVFQADSPDQGVLPVAVTEVLVFIMLIRFRQVVSFVLSRKGGDEACTLFQIEVDVTFQPDGITGIFSGRQVYGTSTFLCGSFDGTVDGGRINRLSVCFCSEIPDIIDCCLHKQATGQ